MTDLPVDYLAAGLLHSLYDITGNKASHSFTLNKLHEFCEKAFGRKYKIEFTKAAVERLHERKVILYVEDPFADEIISADDSTISDFFVSRVDSGDIYSKTWKYEMPWLSTAFKKEHFWSDLERSLESPDQVWVPASDRIVKLDHNNPVLKEIQTAAADLRERLAESNDVGNLRPDQVEVAIAEIGQLEADLNGDALRVGGFRERAEGTLSWIGREAAGALVGTAALALLAAIAAFFGFTF